MTGVRVWLWRQDTMRLRVARRGNSGGGELVEVMPALLFVEQSAMNKQESAKIVFRLPRTPISSECHVRSIQMIPEACFCTWFCSAHLSEQHIPCFEDDS